MVLLCGYGGDGRRINEFEVKQQIINLCTRKTVAIITNAKPKNKIETCEEVSRFLSENNIKNKLFDLNVQDVSWQNYDVIYFGGGSPLRLMQTIENNDFVDFDWKDKILIGQSAGAMILFSKFCDETSLGMNNNPKLEDFKIYKGLAVIDDERVFTPHYNTLGNSIYGKNYLEFLKENKIETLVLNDMDYIKFE